MASRSFQTPWRYDRSRRAWYVHSSQSDHRWYYDAAQDELRDENGHRTPRHANIPRPPPAAPDPAFRLSSGQYYTHEPPRITEVPAGSSTGIPPGLTQHFRRDGVEFFRVQDANGVQTQWATGPPQAITEESLYNQGVTAQRRLCGSDGDVERLYPDFRLQSRAFFCVGRVFLILWCEPAGRQHSSVTFREELDPSFTMGRHGELVHSKVRRFVIIRVGKNYSTAVPIMTYDHQGVSKRGVEKSDHAIIYTGNNPPRPLPEELPVRNEEPMRPRAIRVVPDVPYNKLDVMSRINFGKIITVEHNLKAKSMGMVHPHDIQALLEQFNLVSRPSIPVNAVRPSRRASTVSGGPPSPSASIGSGNRTIDSQEEGRAIYQDLLRRGMQPSAAITESNVALQTREQHSRLIISQRLSSSDAISRLAQELQQQSGSELQAAMDRVRARLSYGRQAASQ